MKHLFIINPVAGDGRCRETADAEIRRVMPKVGGKWEVYYTTGPMDAAVKVKTEAQRCDEELRVYACGGDGTLSECANGAVELENVSVTHFPLGTGNDFIKVFGKKSSCFSDLEALITGSPVKIDLINCNGRHAINICSVGIDARIGTTAHNYSFVKGKMRYAVSLVVNLIKGVWEHYEVKVNGKKYSGDYTLICACNGSHYGGMFNPVPEANPTDGALDFLLVDKVSRVSFMRLVTRYAKGLYKDIEIATYVRGTEMSLRSNREVVVNLDGEAIYSKTVELRLVPGSLNFILPNNLHNILNNKKMDLEYTMGEIR